jgi:hypothetical protein
MTRNDLAIGLRAAGTEEGCPIPYAERLPARHKKRLHFSSAYGDVDLWNTLESRGVKPYKTRGSDGPRVYSKSGKIRASPSSVEELL